MEQVLESLKKQVVKNLESITMKNDMSPAELKTATEAVCLLKEIQQVEYMDDYSKEDEGYSGYSRSHYPSRSSYDDMRRSYGGMSSYDYDRGRSGHSVNDRMIDSLERLLDGAKTEYERETIMKTIEGLRR